MKTRSSSMLARSHWMRAAAIGGITFTVASCNVFDPLDSPSGDEQLLSAARACFDKGDISCARDLYSKVGGSQHDAAQSELVFAMLDEQGANMTAYANFIADLGDNADAGAALTNFANRFVGSAGVDKRVAIWNALKIGLDTTQIQNPDQRNFVTFMAGVALASEILAEAADPASGKLLKNNLVRNATTCDSGNCVTDAACNTPTGTGSNLNAAAGQPNPATLTGEPSNTDPSMDQFFQVVQLAYTALSSLDASGKFSKAATTFNTLAALGLPSGSTVVSGDNNRCFRQQLLAQGIGG